MVSLIRSHFKHLGVLVILFAFGHLAYKEDPAGAATCLPECKKQCFLTATWTSNNYTKGATDWREFKKKVKVGESYVWQNVEVMPKNAWDNEKFTMLCAPNQTNPLVGAWDKFYYDAFDNGTSPCAGGVGYHLVPGVTAPGAEKLAGSFSMDCYYECNPKPTER